MTSSSDSDEEPEIQGRRDIRAILSYDQWQSASKLAYLREKERTLRIKSHENQLELFFPDGLYKRELILDFDPDTKKPIVQVDKKLIPLLKNHQKEGIRFLWNSCCESVAQMDKPGYGCILAHCMGLGKTLQVIAFLHTILNNRLVKISKALVLCPKNTLLNWVNEFDKWIQPPLTRFNVYNASNTSDRGVGEILQWTQTGGVLIMSYNSFRLLIEGLPQSGKRPIYEALINPGPDIVICDEGHILKNEHTKLAKVITEIRTARRVILTGTPLQNNLIEYWCMVNFVRPNLLGTKPEFSNMFVNPILNGQYYNSDSHDVALMKQRSHILYRTLSTCVQRYDCTTLAEFLPEKKEFVLSLRLTEEQVKMYEHYLASFDDRLPWKSRAKGLFADYQLLQRVWTHPYSLKIYDERPPPPKKEKKKSSDDEESDGFEEEVIVRPKKWKEGWWTPFIEEAKVETVRASAKTVILFEIIQMCEARGEKLLIFSGSLFSLEMIEFFLVRQTRNNAAVWTPGEDYLILTGATSGPERDEMCKKFNDPNNAQTRLFMISTRAGGLGITLNAANRAVIFDASWNPSHDIQSIYRIYRLGQTKPCFIYRLIASGTMEEKIYERQVTKQSVSRRVVDEKQIARHYTANELAELYRLEPDRVYKNKKKVAEMDEILKRLIDLYPDLIGGYHEHDSLLIHKVKEELNAAAKDDAWSDFSSGCADLEIDQAVTQIMGRQMFHTDNFKIILRERFAKMGESGICALADRLMPRVEEIFNRTDFNDLMLKAAINARVKQLAETDDASVRTFTKRKGRGFLARLPEPVRVWGQMGGRDFGDPDSPRN